MAVATAAMTLIMAFAAHFDVDRRAQLETQVVERLEERSKWWNGVSDDEPGLRDNAAKLVEETEDCFVLPSEGMLFEDASQEDGEREIDSDPQAARRVET